MEKPQWFFFSTNYRRMMQPPLQAMQEYASRISLLCAAPPTVFLKWREDETCSGLKHSSCSRSSTINHDRCSEQKNIIRKTIVHFLLQIVCAFLQTLVICVRWLCLWFISRMITHNTFDNKDNKGSTLRYSNIKFTFWLKLWKCIQGADSLSNGSMGNLFCSHSGACSKFANLVPLP